MKPASELTGLRLEYTKKTYGTILDCGAGTGDFQQYLKADKIISFDFDNTQMKNISGARVSGNATKLPFKDNVFDCIWACGLIHYIETHINAYMDDWIRVVKPSGKIFIITFNKNSPFDPVLRTAANLMNKKFYDYRKHIVKLYSVAELSKYGQVYGEVRFLPFLNGLIKHIPLLGHSLMLEISVKK